MIVIVIDISAHESYGAAEMQVAHIVKARGSAAGLHVVDHVCISLEYHCDKSKQCGNPAEHALIFRR